jgi:putative oxidoreductase
MTQLSTTASAINFALLMVRVVLGLTVVAHGYQKYFLGGRIPGTAGWFASLGMKPGKFHAYTAATTEITSGLLFAAGLITPVAAAAFVGVMFVAAFIHRHNGFFVFKEGVEYNLVISVVAIAVATIGPGEWSLDHAIGLKPHDVNGWVGFGISAGLGLLAAIGLLVLFYRPPAKADH